jgi:hypothetical protein
VTSVLSSSLVKEDTEALLVREEIRRAPTRSLGIVVQDGRMSAQVELRNVSLPVLLAASS